MQQLVSVDEWVRRFRDAGMDDEAMQKWHRLFEQENPQGHQSFLAWLGLSEKQITAIRTKHA